MSKVKENQEIKWTDLVKREKQQENINRWKSFGIDIDKKPKSKSKSFDKLFKGQKK